MFLQAAGLVVDFQFQLDVDYQALHLDQRCFERDHSYQDLLLDRQFHAAGLVVDFQSLLYQAFLAMCLYVC